MSNNQNWILAAGGLVALAIVLVVAVMLMTPQLQTPGINSPAIASLNGSYAKNMNTQTSGDFAPTNDGAIYFQAVDNGQSKRLLSVSGQVTKTVTPDQAIITLAVETVDKSAQKSQSDNARTTTDVINALRTAGVADKDLKTVGYSLNEQYQWNASTQKNESTGYQTVNTIQVTLSDLTKTGVLIDAASQAGANRIQSVSFSLSNAKQDELRTQALGEAAQNAKSKAQSIATGLGIGIGSVYSASENSSYTTPYYYRAEAYKTLDAVGSAPSPQTPISAGDVEFSATVSVQFEIQ
ncbi:MAG: SIMPL domain-containing protein [Candidatus Diapherotrites archaeon]|nr:SIMPL domain-containing protein [Candidatus Diapherotrites archaeon]